MKKNEVISLNTIVKQKQDIDVTDLNGEKVMMNLDKGQYFALNEVGSRIWDIINKPTTANDIISTLLNEYDIDFKTCENTVVEFLGRLNDAEIISIN